MKKIRLDRWSSQLLLAARPPQPVSTPSLRPSTSSFLPADPTAASPAAAAVNAASFCSSCSPFRPLRPERRLCLRGPRTALRPPRRHQSTAAATSPAPPPPPGAGPVREALAAVAPAHAPPKKTGAQDYRIQDEYKSALLSPFARARDPDGRGRFPSLDPNAERDHGYPSPRPKRALESAKLAALHARLSLPQDVPLETLARTLVDATADRDPRFNNTSLATAGQSLINYHVAEWLMVKYPRLPMAIMYSAMSAYAGDRTLYHVARGWGIDAAAVPGGEVDPGLLQYDMRARGANIPGFGYRRVDHSHTENWAKDRYRRGISSRVVLDDDFGNEVPDPADHAPKLLSQGDRMGTSLTSQATQWGTEETRREMERAHAFHVRAVAGALYAHCGRSAASKFVHAHVLSRHLDLQRLFIFRRPTFELSLLCARECFEPPVARLLSETGRMSRTPVFVVGIFSGSDKLGEAAGPNLDHARWSAAINSLLAWYLYSPGDNVRVPSDMLVGGRGGKAWVPAYIDMGEIISAV